MNILMWFEIFFELFLFGLGVAAKISLVILALAAIRTVNYFVPRKPGRLSSALKAAMSELFKKK